VIPPKPGGRYRALEMRVVVKAIFYVVDGGIKWRMLPELSANSLQTSVWAQIPALGYFW